MPISGGREFQTERIVRGKVLSRIAPWWVRGAARGWEELGGGQGVGRDEIRGNEELDYVLGTSK